MIDCMKTTNYFAERRRMAKQQKDGICKLDCIDCPLSIMNNGTNVSCADFDKLYPEKQLQSYKGGRMSIHRKHI